MKRCDGFTHPDRGVICRNCHGPMKEGELAGPCSRTYEMKRRTELGLSSAGEDCDGDYLSANADLG